jgi:Fe-Mn family superoxide dismutase
MCKFRLAALSQSQPKTQTATLNEVSYMAFSLPPLPYARTALAPHISENTLNFHYGKHHQAYVDNLNKLVAGTPMENQSLEEVIKQSWAEKKTPIFNNSGQVWNHTFYWHSIKPHGGGHPTGLVADKIKQAFGDYEGFKKAFAEAGATQFGSGWAWLVLNNGHLEVRKTPNAETPLTEAGVTPILTMDVWEHAYYLDFQNARPKYIETFLGELVNWDFANANLSDAK